MLIAVDATTGQRLYPPVALGGIITGRAPILDATDASIAKQVAYVASRDNYVYAVDTLTGQILWLVEPNNSTTNLFQGGAAVQMKKFSGGGFTLANDLVVVGTRNGASITTNRIIGMDGNTGSVVWTYTGTAGATTALDIISSTPMVDYLHNAVWVTSRANNGAGQPNLWKLNSVDGTVIFQMNAGSSDIDSSASLTQNGDVLFVGTNGSVPAGTNGRLYAINPLASTSPPVSPAVQGSTVAFYDDGNDGPVRGFPFIVNTAPPYVVVYTTNTMVHAVLFTPATNTFAKLWTTTIFTAPTTNTISAPVVSTVFGFVYVGGSDGYLYELNLATGVVANRAIVNIFYPAVVGDPALDEVNQRVYVSTTTNDQRVYGIIIPY
jgi:outer membrane protein assembly factor BamB